MLLVQDICLSWGKNERGSVSAKMRAEFPLVYSLDKLPGDFHGDAVIHRQSFWQKGTSIQASPWNHRSCFQCYASVQDLNLTNLSIRSDAGSYEVTFFYDERRHGRPMRQGHNKDYHNINSPLYRHDVLNETAFSLGPAQYGRITWNERRIDCDTGEWYYQWHIINLLHDPGRMPKADIFLTHRPDFEYHQMARLY